MGIFLKLWTSTFFFEVFENGDSDVQCKVKSGSSEHQPWDHPVCASPVSTDQHSAPQTENLASALHRGEDSLKTPKVPTLMYKIRTLPCLLKKRVLSSCFFRGIPDVAIG